MAADKVEFQSVAEQRIQKDSREAGNEKGRYLKELLANGQRNVPLDFDTLFPTSGLAKLCVDCKGRVGSGPHCC